MKDIISRIKRSNIKSNRLRQIHNTVQVQTLVKKRDLHALKHKTGPMKDQKSEWQF